MNNRKGTKREALQINRQISYRVATLRTKKSLKQKKMYFNHFLIGKTHG